MKHLIRHTLDYNLTQNPPCNIAPIVAAGLIGAGSALVSGLTSAFSTADTNAKNYKYQRALMQEQHTLGLQNLRQQHHYNIDSLNAAYALENQYNSPQVQKYKMLAAGLNPYYNEAGAVSAQSNPNPTSVGLPSATLPSYQYQSPWAAFANLPVEFANVANATKAIAEAKKIGVDTTQQERAMETYLNDLYERWRGSKLANDYQEVLTDWYKDNGKHYLDEKQRELTAEIGDKIADGDLKGAQKLLVEAQKDKQLKDNALFDKIQTFLEQKAQYEAQNAHAQVGATKAQEQMFIDTGKANLVSASANAKNAETNRLRAVAENKLTDMIIENTRLDNQQKEALIVSLNTNANIQRLIDEANNTPFAKWCIKAKTVISNMPIVGNFFDAIGGYGAMYGAATAGTLTAESIKNKPKPRVKVKGFK